MSAWPAPGEIGAPSDQESEALTKESTEELKSQFTVAVNAMYLAKLRSGDKTPWRQLVDQYRLTLPVRAELQIVDVDGEQRTQLAVTERGFGLKGDDALMFNAITELSEALAKIENFEPQRHMNRAVRERAHLDRQSKNGKLGGRPKATISEEREISSFLKRRDYANSMNKKAIVSDAMTAFEVGRTKVYEVAKASGLVRGSKTER